MNSVQSTLFDELEIVAEKPHCMIKTVGTKSMPEELCIDDISTEEVTKEVTVPCVECGEQAHIKIHGKEFCMEHYENYFYRTEGIKFGEFEFI